MAEPNQSDLIVTPVDDDVVIYDQARHVTHHLNATAATIWRACGRTSDRREISEQTSLPDATVRVALEQLSQAGLVRLPDTQPQTRRQLLKRATVTGVLTPVVISLSAPLAAHAASDACLAPPNPSVTVTFAIIGSAQRVFANFAGFCPLTTYNQTRYFRYQSNQVVNGPLGPNPFTTDENGHASFLVASFAQIGGYDYRVDTDYSSSGWVTAPGPEAAAVVVEEERLVTGREERNVVPTVVPESEEEPEEPETGDVEPQSGVEETNPPEETPFSTPQA